MEKSLKRVEKLVHATNAALAQMKLGLMFDDAVGEKEWRRAGALGESLGFRREGAEDLRQCQEEFRTEAEEILSKMEKVFESKDPKRKNSVALGRIKEINRRMNMMRQERGKAAESEQSRQKLLGLVAEEKSTPEKSDRNTPHPAPRPAAPHRRNPQRPPDKADSLSLTHPPAKTKQELKNNIRETREIVDRGFHTARQLVQKVDNIAKNEKKDKTPGSEGAVSEVNGRSSEGRSESNETTRSVRCRKVDRTLEKGRGDAHEEELGNAKVVNIRRRECRSGRRVHLKLQRLPSVHIAGGLQLQKVHSLEIPASGGQGCPKANTSIQILSHEQIEKIKLEKILERVRQENCCCADVFGGLTKNALEKYVECSSCGKLIKVQRSRGVVDPRKLDEILKKCNFNVFDPRIDEFIEKHGATDAAKWCKPETEEAVAEGAAPEESVVDEEKSETSWKARHFSLEDLTNRVSSRYREEADALEDSHLQLDKVLRTLLRKMDESREVFEECSLFKNEKALSTTKPVVLSLPESSSRSRRKKKLDKKDVKNRSKSRPEVGVRTLSVSSFSDSVGVKRVEKISLFPEKAAPKSKLSKREGKNSEEGRRETGFRRGVAEEKVPSLSSSSSCQNVGSDRPTVVLGKDSVMPAHRRSKVEKTGVKVSSPLPVGQWTWLREEERASDDSLAPSSSSVEWRKPGDVRTVASANPCGSGGEGVLSSHSVVTLGSEEKAISEASPARSGDNYESDFETSANELEEEPEPELIICANKLSTISEEDSELDKKVSDEQKTQKSSFNSETPLNELQEDLSAKYQRTNTDLVKIERSSPLASDVSRKSRRPEDSSSRTADASLKSTPTELVTSLKDILSALKDQFARTETLAEKLTESARQEASAREGARSPWATVEGLRSARREAAPPVTLSGVVGSSLGGVVMARRRKEGSSSEASLLKSDRSEAFRREEKINSKLNPSSEEGPYSEGEIPSDVLQDSECCSSHSVGEIHH